jgi:hypothetical protein
MTLRKRLDELERAAGRLAPAPERTAAFDHERYAALWRAHPVGLDEWRELLSGSDWKNGPTTQETR